MKPGDTSLGKLKVHINTIYEYSLSETNMNSPGRKINFKMKKVSQKLKVIFYLAYVIASSLYENKTSNPNKLQARVLYNSGLKITSRWFLKVYLGYKSQKRP